MAENSICWAIKATVTTAVNLKAMPAPHHTTKLASGFLDCISKKKANSCTGYATNRAKPTPSLFGLSRKNAAPKYTKTTIDKVATEYCFNAFNPKGFPSLFFLTVIRIQGCIEPVKSAPKTQKYTYCCHQSLGTYSDTNFVANPTKQCSRDGESHSVAKVFCRFQP